ncbi:hypothetical protein D0C36_11245 [Mucilaginibacter conchicola]|uniref:Lipocalin-like domain-containing protein n=1 Tax=Mucilaginibacter conchicola TaxID=2303333 RepID=A0A372NRZ2_9SPHI|nr:hypothetical protein [Mucilaginibacter conchicola]RFZ92015.1 hypothetical protein D0C36_11245 [Mucilaginibacter conchicola]
MKYFILPLLALAFLASCKNKAPKQEQQQDTISTKPSSNTTADLIAKFKPIFTGNWVKISYIDKVIATKSPLAAMDKVKGITCILFDRHKVEGDSLMVLLGWENHDSSESPLRFKRGKRENSLQLGDSEIQYSVIKGDTVLTLYWVGENHKVTTTVYKKSPLANDNLGTGLEYFINKGLVAGNYIMTDSNAVKSKVSLSANGIIKGFSPFKTYNIHNDLNEEPMDNLDRIGFSDGKTVPYTWFTFKITGDTLKLFSTKPNADSSLLEIDKLRYTLIRQK